MRKRKKFKRIEILSVVILLIISLIVPVFADSIQDYEQKKESSQNIIDSNQKVINNTQPVIDQIEKQIVDLDQSISTLNTEITTLQSQITQLESDIETTRKELEEAVKKEEDQNDLLNERLRVQYMYGVEGYSEVLFSEDDLTGQIENSQILTDIFQADHDLLEQLKANRALIEEKEKQLEAQKAELNQKKTSLDGKKKEQESAKAQKEQILKQNQKIIEEAKVKIAQEEAAIANANANIQRLAEEAERQKLAEQQNKAKTAQKEIKTYATQIAQISKDVVSAYGNSNDEDITDNVRKVQALAASVSEKNDNINNVVSQTENAKTAAAAVEANTKVDSVISAASSNVSEAQELKAELAELDLQKKKEEAEKAAQSAEDKRQQEIQQGQEKVKAEAQKKEEEAKKAEEEARKAKEAAEKAKEEAKKKEEAEKQQEQQAPKNNWEDNYFSRTGWRWPLDGIYDITSVFGYRVHPIFGVGRGHEGIDIGASSGTPVHSCDGGTVIMAAENGGYGNCVIVQQNSGHQVYYGHLSGFNCSKGDHVNPGDVIGYVGSTGWSTGPHLHLGVLSGGSFVDPFTFFPEMDG